jgi:hypothetical protein
MAVFDESDDPMNLARLSAYSLVKIGENDGKIRSVMYSGGRCR